MMNVQASLLAPFDGPASGDPRKTGTAYARAFFRTAFPVAVFCDVLDATESQVANDDEAKRRGADPAAVALYWSLFKLAALVEYRRLMKAARSEGGTA